MPAVFGSQTAKEYWHMAADIAYAAGIAVVARDGKCWLIDDEGEHLFYHAQGRRASLV